MKSRKKKDVLKIATVGRGTQRSIDLDTTLQGTDKSLS